MNIILIAEESAGIHMLREIERGGHQLIAVMASPGRIAASGASLWEAAVKRGLPTWPAHLVQDASLAEKVRAEDVDILLNVHSLYVIHAAVLGAPRIGAFNLHPGPLPRYAGLNAVSWAIYRGERSHGVTVHWMAPEIDAGPIAYQSLFPIDENDTALSLSARCVREGVPLMMRLLDVASKNPAEIPAIPQDMQKREYFDSKVPEGGRLSWQWPAEKIVDFVRACDYFPFRSPWGHPRTRMGSQELAVVKARRTRLRSDSPPGTVGEFTGEGVKVASGDEWLLVTKLKVGKESVHPATVLKSGEQLVNGAT
jgi:methionyl-tRNA formyltransferase